jgi:3-oxoacyl-[acyl-carrier protein] reductase
MSNQTRTVIVTGASKGIGAQLAKQLASDGFQTIVNYSASADEAKEVVASIEKAGGRAKAIAADVADASAMRTLFDQAEAEFGPVDVLVHQVSDWCSGAAANFDSMREAKRENTRCGL